MPSIENNSTGTSDASQGLNNLTIDNNSTAASGAPQGVIGPTFNMVNLFWIYSLIFSIYCALHALVLQQLARPRTWVTSPCHSLPDQARMAAYFTGRIKRAEQTIRTFQSMIIISIVVFFSGLCIYLFNIDIVTAIIALFLIGLYPDYLIIRHVIPYFRHLRRQAKILRAGSRHYTPSTQEKEKVQERRSRSDSNVLTQTLDISRSDDDLEEFFEAIPGFCASKFVDNPRLTLEVLGLPRLAEALIAFWNRTLSSNRVAESVKVRRLVVCVKVVEATDLSIAVPHILHLLLSGDLSGVSRSVETGHSLRPLRNGNAASLARGIIASIISNAEHNERWSTLAMDELGISKDDLRDYLAHGDSMLLANMIHITRHLFHSLLQHDSDLTRKSSGIISSLSKLDILNTLPELQRDFCGLWNKVVQEARDYKADDNPFIDILVAIRHLYVDLHGTDFALGHFFTSATGHDDLFKQPATYPLCMLPDHHDPQSTTHIQEADDSTTHAASHTTTAPEPTTQTPSSTTGDSDQPPNEGTTVSFMTPVI